MGKKAQWSREQKREQGAKEGAGSKRVFRRIIGLGNSPRKSDTLQEEMTETVSVIAEISGKSIQSLHCGFLFPLLFGSD